jgi:hypothetical protein
MVTITLYRQDGNTKYEKAANVNVDHGVLTFYINGKKITTTVPFVVEENLAVAA